MYIDIYESVKVLSLRAYVQSADLFDLVLLRLDLKVMIHEGAVLCNVSGWMWRRLLPEFS